MQGTMQTYDYARREGVEELTWGDFAELCTELTEMIDRERADIVLGIARAGLFPATAVAIALRREMYPIRLTRRHNDVVAFDRPQWRVPVPAEVEGKVVAVVDEIADTGETLAMVSESVRAHGATRVVTATLVAHSWADPLPTHVPLVTDAFVLFPWDRQVLVNGQWQPHPEVTAALEALGEPDS
jgi:uncharacterized protein